MNKQMDLAPAKFASRGPRKNDQAADIATSYLEARVRNLEENQVSVQEDVGTLKELVHGLSPTVEQMNKSGGPVRTGPSQGIDGIEASFESAKRFSMDLHRLKNAFGSVDSESGNTATELTADVHVKVSESGTANGTNKHPMPTPVPTLPRSIGTLISTQDVPLIKHISLEDQQDWRPYHVTTLRPFSGPIPSDTVTFHPDFLANHLGGIPWSPGLRFIQCMGPCMLKNRTYYQMDPENEPYLPKAPGEHGAKLMAFFNNVPEGEFGNLFPDDATSYENVPMFILAGGRYVYYGNYSQTRWSDKLDHDTMATKVPDHIKNFWAEELASPVRDQWVTEALKKHFFRMPEYNGRLFAAPEIVTTVNTAEDVKLNEKMMKDVRRYVDKLRQWGREASIKTAMIKKQTILDAFNASDMDEQPALRLWWEYLECVDWRKDFYDFLVTLQEREGQKYA